MVVTFFGHRDIAEDISDILQNTIIDVIKKYGADMFLVGNHGSFDRLVQTILEKLCDNHNIDYRIVLPYIPKQNNEYSHRTIVFDGFESVPPKYAIPKRNQWMLDKSDIVITYVIHNIGGAAKTKAIAHKKGKLVINIPDRRINH